MSREQSGGLSVTTLLIASGSAAAAAVIVPLFWERGSLVAAAITPVIVALTSEGLKKPVEKIPTVGVWRKTPQGTAVRQPGGRDFEVHDPEEERLEVDPAQADDPFGLREPERAGVFTRRRVDAGARHRPARLRDRRRRGHGVRAGDLRRLRLAPAPHDLLRRQVQEGHPDADRDADGHPGGRGRDADADPDAERDAVARPRRRRRRATPTPSVAPNAATPEPGATPAPTP